MISSRQIDIQCPICARRVRVRLGDVSAGRTVSCAVGHRIRLREQGHGIADADRALREFERSLQRLNRRLR